MVDGDITPIVKFYFDTERCKFTHGKCSEDVPHDTVCVDTRHVDREACVVNEVTPFRISPVGATKEVIRLPMFWDVRWFDTHIKIVEEIFRVKALKNILSQLIESYTIVNHCGIVIENDHI